MGAPPTPRYFKIEAYQDDGTTPLLTVTSLPPSVDPSGCYLAAPPNVTGATFDPVTGETVAAQAGARALDRRDPATGQYLVTSALTDAAFRYDLLGRSAVVAWTDTASLAGPWTPYVVGALTRCVMSEAHAWDLAVSEDATAEQTAELFRAPNAALDLPRWFWTSLVGGPVRGGAYQSSTDPLPDWGGWRYQIASIAGDVVRLNFVAAWINRGTAAGTSPGAVYGGGAGTDRGRTAKYRGDVVDFDEIQGTLSQADSDAVNDLARPYWRPEATYYAAEKITGSYRDGLGARLERYATGAQVVGPELRGEFVPLAQSRALTLSGGFASSAQLTRGGDLVLEWPAAVAAADRVVGREFAVYVTPYEASSDFPVWGRGHLVNLVADAYRAAGRAVDAASEAAAVQALGPELVALLGFTKGQTPAEVAAPLFGIGGFSRRANASGAAEFFVTRGARSAAAPAVTLTLDDLHPDSLTTPVFDLASGSVVNRVVVQQQGYPSLELDPTDAAEMAASRKRFGVRAVTYNLPGQMLAPDGGLSFFFAAAAELFDRGLRGQPEGAVVCVDTANSRSAREGDELVLDLPHLVNPATAPASRGALRLFAVVERTPDPGRGTITLALREAGAADQVATAPTLSIAQSADDPRHVAVVTVTNAAALAATGLLVRLEWTTGAGAPSGAGARVAAIDPAATTTARTPGVLAAGETVQARAQSTTRDGRRPSAFSAWASVALASLPAPSALAATPDAADGTRMALAWSVGASDLPVEVRGRITASEPALRVLALLPPGSTQRTLTGLTAGSGYTFDMRHRETAPYDGASASTTTTATTSATVPTLAAPTDLIVFSDGRGRWRASTTATEGGEGVSIEFEVAVETAPSSGTPGSYGFVLRRPAVLDAYVEYSSGEEPDDGRLRYVRARHVRAGATASGYTPVVTVAPYEISAPPGVVPTTPAPSLGSGSRVGGGVSFTIVPGAGTPAGTVYDVEYDDGGGWTMASAGRTNLSFSGIYPTVTTDFRATARRAGWAASAPSATLSL